MYSAKSSGRHMLVEFDHALNAELDERMLLRRDLRHALADGQMFVVFQPRVAGTHGQIASVEALLRWRHPDKGFVSPEIFIALAEESEFILELGRWVLRQALGQFQQWRSIPNHPVRHLSVNLSPLQLADPALPAQLQALLEEFHIQPGELELEITEGALIRDVDTAVERLAALRALGVAIALDDFGALLGHELPEPTAVRHPQDRQELCVCLRGGAPCAGHCHRDRRLAKALDKRVVAEGVETPEQAALL